MYKILDKEFIRFEGEQSVYRAEIGCDTEADLPAAEIGNLTLAPFSVALIADTKEIKVLNSEGVWV